MVLASDRISASGFLIPDFPLDRPQSPAWLTVPLSKLYEQAARWYHRRYDQAVAYHAPVPVISVGNITVGGTGKTPTVMGLARLIWKLHPEFKEPNRLAILSRGYGRKSRMRVVVNVDSDWKECGDEPLLMKHALPEAAVVVHADRVRAARYATEELGARFILLDDGFQHRRLARDLDVVLVDGEHPAGNGHLLPAGPLREPIDNLRRASLILGIGETCREAEKLAGGLGKPFLSATPQVRLPHSVADGSVKDVLALASIARPNRFIKFLTNNGLNVISQELFADHHRYSIKELESVSKKAIQVGAKAVVTTEKDKARIPSWPYSVPLLVVGLEMLFENETYLGKIIGDLIAKT